MVVNVLLGGCYCVINGCQGVAKFFLGCSEWLPLVTFWSGSSVVFFQLFTHPTGKNDASDY